MVRERPYRKTGHPRYSHPHVNGYGYVLFDSGTASTGQITKYWLLAYRNSRWDMQGLYRRVLIMFDFNGTPYILT